MIKFFTTKKQLWIGIGIIAGLLIILVVILVLMRGSQPKTSSSDTTASTPTPTATPPTPTPTPVTTADPLTGIQVDPSAAAQPVVAVMIENLAPDARPQSGLGQAGIVYEALAEGGITRFMALFQEPFPPTIGPIRSLRPYYLEWGLEHGIPVVHAGGSQPALAEIGPSHLKNIDALAYDGVSFYRSTDRYAPHNLYTTSDMLAKLDTKLGFATAPTFQPFAWKADAPQNPAPHTTISIPYSGPDYAVKYVYDATTNTYARFMAGVAHIDRNTTTQIHVKNVVVQFTATTYGTQPDGKPETNIQDVGSGKALIFNDGGVVVGTWSKASASAQTQFLDATGKPATFDAGNTWISVVPADSVVTY